MGASNCKDRVLSKGWEATINDCINSAKTAFAIFGTWSLKTLKEFCLHFARKADIQQDGSIQDIFRQFCREATIGVLATNQGFIEFCGDILKEVVRRALAYPAAKKLIQAGIEACTKAFQQNYPAIATACNELFIQLLESAEEQLAREAAGTGAKEIATNTLASTAKSAGTEASKTALAKTAAKSALKSAVFVDGALLGVSAGYWYYKYKRGQITWEEYERHMAMRSAATAGSVTGTTAGAFVGTLIFPGVGSFFGGIVGGMVGDYYGSKAGQAMYDGAEGDNHPHPHIE